MTELDKILEGLIRRTTEGRLKWSRTFQSDRFVTSVDAVSIVISERFHSVYGLEILNEDGETVESIESPYTSEAQNRQFERLFVLARRSALNSEATLQKLAKSLNS